jgi:hypothetical protein
LSGCNGQKKAPFFRIANRKITVEDSLWALPCPHSSRTAMVGEMAPFTWTKKWRGFFSRALLHEK